MRCDAVSNNCSQQDCYPGINKCRSKYRIIQIRIQYVEYKSRIQQIDQISRTEKEKNQTEVKDVK